jgi:small GTP-binding protein
MLGDPGVGKTSLVRRFVLDIFDDEYIPSIGMKVTKKQINLKSLDLTLMIWDILGSKTNRFDDVYYKGVKGAFLVSDVTREDTADHIPKWLSGLFEITGDIPVIFLANKDDIIRSESNYEKKLEKFCKKYKSRSLFTSAKTGENVEKAFEELGKEMVKRITED